MKWIKGKQIFSPKLVGAQNTHAQVPFALLIENRVRVYFTSRPPAQDGAYISYMYYADFDPNDLSNVLHVEKQPLIPVGNIGAFDEFGTMPCSIITIDGHQYLYYVGWSRLVSVPYNSANGLAISKDSGKTFQKYSEGPIMSQTVTDPYIVGCPRVFKFNDKLYMWYIGGTGWMKGIEKNESIYHLKLAVSEDGIKWETISHNLLKSKYADECQTCATVFEHNNLYHMYFTYRHVVDFRNPERGYRIGYATSTNLIDWERKDEEGGIERSETGWDSEMISYPHVIKINDDFVMFYCGNYFGIDGFGYATLQK